MSAEAQFRVIEDADDCIAEAVRACGGHKVVGPMLWPDMPAEQASRKLADHLNANRPERLKFTQIVFILRMARDKGYHGAKHWLDTELGYRPSDPIEPEDAMAQLMREYIESTKTNKQTADRLERLFTTATTAKGRK